MTTLRRSVEVLAACALVAAPVAAVHAQAPVAPGADLGGLGMAKMSVREMVGCGQKLVDIDAQENDIRKGDVALSDEMAYLKTAGRAIDADRPHVNTRDEKQIAAFNHRIALYQGLVVKFNGEVQQRNAKAQAIHADSNDFAVNCAHRPYDPEDLKFLPTDIRGALEHVSTRQEVPLFFQPAPPSDAPAPPSASAATQPPASPAAPPPAVFPPADPLTAGPD